MKSFLKLALVFSVMTLFYGCDGFMTNSSTTTTTTTTETSSESTTTTTTTTTTSTHTVDPMILSTIETEYQSIQSKLPYALSETLELPLPTNPDVIVMYYANSQLVLNNELVFTPLAYDFEIELTIRLIYQRTIIDKSFVIIQLRDEELYQQSLNDEVFESALAYLQAEFPKTIVSDFTLPTYNVSAIDIDIDVVGDYRIYQNRFIFTFPEHTTSVEFDVAITYQKETRHYTIPVTMKAFDELPLIPQIHIWTVNNQGVYSKDYYVTGDLTLTVFDDNNVPLTLLYKAPLEIRTRGNSTSTFPKLPYKIKFAEKTPMLSEYAQRDWVLLANYTDHTLIRNALAHQLSASMEMEFSPMTQFVDLYLNGDYMGNFILTDQVEVSNHRVNIEEGSADLDTGYLIEYDMRLEDPWVNKDDFNHFYIRGIPFVIKSPQEDDPNYSLLQYHFIEDYMLTLYNTLEAKQPYDHLIDEATFIDWFIIEELFKNVDSGYSSVFLYKDKGGLLKMGPIWDFDLSTGNPGHLSSDLRGPEGWYTALEYKNRLFYFLMKYPGFQDRLTERWNELYDDVLSPIIDSIYPISDSIAKSRYMNFERWDVIGTNWDWYTASEIYDLKTYEEQVYFLYNYLATRLIWMDEELNK